MMTQAPVPPRADLRCPPGAPDPAAVGHPNEGTVPAVTRDALIAAARADAERILEAARADVAAERAGAEQAARELLERAAAAGVADATEEWATRRAQLIEERRSRVRHAQRAVYEQWRRESTAAALALRDDEKYPALRESLRDLAIRLLGPDADIVEDPRGGVVARAGSRVLDLRLSTLAARALEQFETGAEGLWQ